MKNIKIFVAALILVFFTGCSDEWFDINQDPNKLSELENGEVLIPVAQVNIANALMGWHSGFAGAFWSQYWTQDHNSSQFRYLDEYDETDFEYTYYNLTSSALIDFKKAKEAVGEGTGVYYVAEVLSIYTWQIITDLWGDIPYFDALKGEDGVYSPAFDSQSDIYTDLLQRINTLLNEDYSSVTYPDDYDFIYDSDMDNWISFAKTLKLKLMLRLSETSNYSNSELLSFIEEGGFISSTAMISGGIWQDTDTKRHPMAEFEDAGYFDNVIASRTFLEYLTANNDPRLSSYYEMNSEGMYQGCFQGDFASEDDTDGDGTDDDKESYSTVTFSGEEDIPLIAIWDLYFYIAEVYTRAGDNTNAKSYYDQAVQASCDYWGATNDVTISGGYGEWSNGTVEDGIQQIAMQKWVAYCKLQHTEAFIERNRTKYPAVNDIDVDRNREEVDENFPVGYFTLSVAGRAKLSEKLPSSPLYPSPVISRNSNDLGQKSSLGEKVWWDQKDGI